MSTKYGQLDTTVEIVTPENIAFRYQVAGPFRRLPAYLIDLMIRVLAAIAAMIGLMITFGAAGIPDVGAGLALAIWFVLAAFYGGLFETYWNGQTPGKRAMQIRVIAIDGQPINGLQAVLRNLLRAIDMQPAVFYAVGLLTATMNDRFQRLGDLACGTMVVIEEPHWFRGLVQINEPEALRLAGLIPVDFQPSRPLTRALAAYVQRRSYFPPMRRVEIARHVGDLLREQFGLPPDTDLDQLLCGLYYRTFITDRNGNTPAGVPAAGIRALAPSSPFASVSGTAALPQRGASPAATREGGDS